MAAVAHSPTHTVGVTTNQSQLARQSDAVSSMQDQVGPHRNLENLCAVGYEQQQPKSTHTDRSGLGPQSELTHTRYVEPAVRIGPGNAEHGVTNIECGSRADRVWPDLSKQNGPSQPLRSRSVQSNQIEFYFNGEQLKNGGRDYQSRPQSVQLRRYPQQPAQWGMDSGGAKRPVV